MFTKWGRNALLAAGVSAVAISAHAVSVLDLSSPYAGNMLGLAYRASDGHFFTTQDAMVDDAYKAFVHEFDSNGTLLRSADIGSMVHGIADVSTISASQTSKDLYVGTLAYAGNEAPPLEGRYVKLSGDLTVSTDNLPSQLVNYVGSLEGSLTDPYILQVTDTQLLGIIGLPDSQPTVSIISRATGQASNIDLAPFATSAVGCFDSLANQSTMCLKGIASSWHGGFFAISDGYRNDDHSVYQETVAEFSADGQLIHAMSLDPALFGQGFTAIDVDLAGHRVLVSFNGEVVMLSESDFLNGTLAPLSVPEPGTWALWALGALFLPVAVRRAQRPS